MATATASAKQLETDRALIEAELKRLLRLRRFSSATQMSAFLQYIVIQTLDGNAGRIKAYTVGVDALGKPDSFDAQTDPSVRVLALRLRRSLHASYEEDGGSPLARVVLSVGTYVPEFLKVEPGSVGQQREPSVPAVSEKLTSDARIPQTATAETSPKSTHLQTSNPGDMAGNAMNYVEQADGSGDTVKAGSHVATLRDKSWVVSIVVLLVVVGWTVSTSQNDSHAQRGGIIKAMVQFGSASEPKPADDETTVLQDKMVSVVAVPTLYMPCKDSHSFNVKHVSTLLGSSVVQHGSVDVVRVSEVDAAKRVSANVYWMVIDEILVDSRPTVVAQLLRPDSGAVLMSATMQMNSATGGFSSEEMLWIEELAMDVTSINGPLFQDHCADLSSPATDRCAQGTDL